MSQVRSTIPTKVLLGESEGSMASVMGGTTWFSAENGCGGPVCTYVCVATGGCEGDTGVRKISLGLMLFKTMEPEYIKEAFQSACSITNTFLSTF